MGQGPPTGCGGLAGSKLLHQGGDVLGVEQVPARAFSVRVYLANAPGHAHVQVRLDGVPLTTVICDASGNVRGQPINLPAGLTVGPHHIQAIAQDSTATATLIMNGAP